MTDVERGFQDYFAARRIPVQITFRDLNRDNSRMAGFLEEIKRTAPTSSTRGAPRSRWASWAPTTGSIPRRRTSPTSRWCSRWWPRPCSPRSSGPEVSRRNVTGVFTWRPPRRRSARWPPTGRSSRIGILYTPTEQNSVVVVEEVREVSQRLGFTVIAKPLKFNAAQAGHRRRRAGDDPGLKKQNVDWLYLPPDSYLGTQTQEGHHSRGDVGGHSHIRLHRAADGDRRAHGAHQPLLRDRPVHRLQGGADPHEQGAAGADPRSRPSRASRCRCAWTWRRQLKMPPPLPMFNYAELIVPKRRRARAAVGAPSASAQQAARPRSRGLFRPRLEAQHRVAHGALEAHPVAVEVDLGLGPYGSRRLSAPVLITRRRW